MVTDGTDVERLLDRAGNVIKVSYKGTESEYTVDPTTPIFGNATGDRSLLVPAPGYS